MSDMVSFIYKIIICFFFLNVCFAQKDDVIEKSINAYGGLDTYNSIKTWKKIYLINEFKINNNAISTNPPYLKFPDKSYDVVGDTIKITKIEYSQKGCCTRTDLTIHGKEYESIIAHNGVERIIKVHNYSNHSPEPYSIDDEQIFNSPFGYLFFEVIETLENVMINGELCNSLKLRSKNIKYEVIIYISIKDNLIKRSLSKNKTGTIISTLRNYYEYKDNNGFKVPNRIQEILTIDDDSKVRNMILEAIEINPEFSKETFFQK